MGNPLFSKKTLEMLLAESKETVSTAERLLGRFN